MTAQITSVKVLGDALYKYKLNSGNRYYHIYCGINMSLIFSAMRSGIATKSSDITKRDMSKKKKVIR